MKKLLDSDWRRAVQFKCNTGAKSVTPVQIAHRNSGLWLVERQWEICRPMISCEAMIKILYRKSEKSFLECEKMASKNISRHFFRANFHMFVLFISNHTVFLVWFEINLHLWIFQKAEIARLAARAISAFWKTHNCKLIQNWTRNRMITYIYTFMHQWCQQRLSITHNKVCRVHQSSPFIESFCLISYWQLSLFVSSRKWWKVIFFRTLLVRFPSDVMNQLQANRNHLSQFSLTLNHCSTRPVAL